MSCAKYKPYGIKVHTKNRISGVVFTSGTKIFCTHKSKRGFDIILNFIPGILGICIFSSKKDN